MIKHYLRHYISSYSNRKGQWASGTPAIQTSSKSSTKLQSSCQGLKSHAGPITHEDFIHVVSSSANPSSGKASHKVIVAVPVTLVLLGLIVLGAFTYRKWKRAEASLTLPTQYVEGRREFLALVGNRWLRLPSIRGHTRRKLALARVDGEEAVFPHPDAGAARAEIPPPYAEYVEQV